MPAAGAALIHAPPLDATGAADAACIDLRSDTVTRPTATMREAMARADVGDDVYGEDPTVRRLEETVAALLGKEAALFVPSGTMANQIALQLHTRRGDEVIVGEDAHIVADESGAGAAWAGVQFRTAGRDGVFTPEQLRAVIQEPDMHCPRQSLVSVENPHNRAGGHLFAQAHVVAIAALARGARLALHLDGARLWNAAEATGRGGGGDRGAIRHGQRLFFEGARRAGGLGALRARVRRDRGGAPLPQAVWRRHAAGGRARGGGAPRARAPPGPARRGSRAREG